MKSNDHSANNSKKKYEKPKLQSFALRTDEVMGVGCKTASDLNVAGISASTPCWGDNCNAEGS